MAQLFAHASPEAEAWLVYPLDGPCHALAAGAGGSLAPRPGDGGDGDVVLLRSAAPDAGETWSLLAAPGAPVWLNGLPLLAGVAVLRDRDEVRVGGLGRVFFSSERLATTEPFEGPEPTQCPRCWLPIESRQATARCAGCGLRMHAAPTKPCFEHEGPCPGCGAATQLDGELLWDPQLCGF